MPLDNIEPVLIVPASESWHHEFAALARALGEVLGQSDEPGVSAPEIDHIGSTAVPGLPGKPILDVAVVHSGDAKRIRDRLQSVGYRSEGERGVPGRESFRRLSSRTPTHANREWMDHHLYLTPGDSGYLSDQRTFRDYLRTHPEHCAAYGRLKTSLAAAHGEDRSAYTEAKGSFVRSVLASARSDESPGPMDQIRTDQFASLDLRVGTVIEANPLPNARVPAIVVTVHLGPLGCLTSSARITDRYSASGLLGRQIVCVANLPPRQIGSVVSRCLVLGADSENGIVLLSPDRPVGDGARVW